MKGPAPKFYHMLALIVAHHGVPSNEKGTTWIGPKLEERSEDPNVYEGPIAHIDPGYRYAILANEDETGHVLISMSDDPMIRHRRTGALHLQVQLFGCFTTGGTYGNPAVMFTQPDELIRTHGEMNKARNLLQQTLRDISENLRYF
jgi:hypothetical protein